MRKAPTIEPGGGENNREAGNEEFHYLDKLKEVAPTEITDIAELLKDFNNKAVEADQRLVNLSQAIQNLKEQYPEDGELERIEQEFGKIKGTFHQELEKKGGHQALLKLEELRAVNEDIEFHEDSSNWRSHLLNRTPHSEKERKNEENNVKKIDDKVAKLKKQKATLEKEILDMLNG